LRRKARRAMRNTRKKLILYKLARLMEFAGVVEAQGHASFRPSGALETFLLKVLRQGNAGDGRSASMRDALGRQLHGNARNDPILVRARQQVKAERRKARVAAVEAAPAGENPGTSPNYAKYTPLSRADPALVPAFVAPNLQLAGRKSGHAKEAAVALLQIHPEWSCVH
jgi:hypothetical protein